MRSVVLLLSIAAASVSAQTKSPPSPVEQFRQILTAEYAIIARGDSARLAPRLASDLAWVIGPTGAHIGKTALLRGVARGQSPAPQFSIDSVEARVIGRVALVEYVRSDRRAVGSYVVSTRSRCHDAFIRRGSSWVLARHSQAWILSPVNPTDDFASADDFIGRYRIADDYVDDVHREGTRLVATASGQTGGATLIPVSANAFSPDGIGALMVFERDRSGRVTGYVQGYPDGRVVRAIRLP